MPDSVLSTPTQDDLGRGVSSDVLPAGWDVMVCQGALCQVCHEPRDPFLAAWTLAEYGVDITVPYDGPRFRWM